MGHTIDFFSQDRRDRAQVTGKGGMYQCNLEKEYKIFPREGAPLVSLAAVFVSSRNAPPEERCV